jgi:excisionase family DNA binding protein
MTNRPKFYTTGQAAQKLGMNRSTIYRAVRGNKIPSCRPFGTYQIPAAFIDEMLRQLQEVEVAA